MKVAVIGGGASGFFAAINCKSNYPNATIHLLEKTQQTLSKVKVSGGGRCNVTHHQYDPVLFSKNYPRGAKHMKKLLKQFSAEDTVNWFKDRGVELHTEADGRMFPISNQSSTIINCFHHELERLEIELKLGQRISKLEQKENAFQLTINDQCEVYTHVIIAIGGVQKLQQLDFLSSLALKFASPLPSLFTFNVKATRNAEIMGTVVSEASVKVLGTKISETGPVLFTHWGFSGPAILRASAWGAKALAEKNYEFTVSFNWTNFKTEDELRNDIAVFQKQNGKKKLSNAKPVEGLTNKMWIYLLNKVAIDSNKTWMECGKKQLNKITNILFNDQYNIKGKTTFKEEFVTCGGLDLSQVDINTMQHKGIKGLFFTGEFCNIDGITGGFNFQCAWSTAYAAAKLGL